MTNDNFNRTLTQNWFDFNELSLVLLNIPIKVNGN